MHAPLVLARRLLLVVALVAVPAVVVSAQPATVVDVIRRSADGSLLVEELSVPSDQVEVIVAGLRSQSDVVAAGVSHRRELVTVEPDPMVASQWGYHRVGGASAGEVGTGRGLIVAVLDTGVDGSHPEFAGRVLPGWDALDASGDGRFDPNGHGTHVAGIVAAAVDGAGIQGLAPEVSILPVRVLGADGVGDDTHLAMGIIWAVDHGAHLMNLSIGGAVPSTLLEDAITYALDRNVLVVVAAGNDALTGNAPSYPAAYPEALAVGATDSYDRRSLFSNTGSYVDLAAPGSWVLSTWPGGRYQSLSGTSMAAPFVAAAAAVVQERSGFTGRQLREYLTATAYDLGPTGRDDEFGAGLVNVLAPVGGSPGAPDPDSPASPVPPLPPVQMPTLPPVSLPPLTMPTLPSVSLPPVSLPPVSLPPVSLPALPSSSLPPSAAPPQQRVTLDVSTRRSGVNVTVTIRLNGPKALVARQTLSVRSPSGSTTVVTDWKGQTTVRLMVPRSAQITVSFAGSALTAPVSSTLTP